MSLYIGFMYDCHLFANVTTQTANEEQATVSRLLELFSEDGCGMAFAEWRNADRTLAAPHLHGHRMDSGTYGVTPEEVSGFVRAALAFRPPLLDPGVA